MNITRYFRAIPSGPARIEVFDRQGIAARQRRRGLGQIVRGLDTDEKLAGVVAGRAQQKRKSQAPRRGTAG